MRTAPAEFLFGKICQQLCRADPHPSFPSRTTCALLCPSKAAQRAVFGDLLMTLGRPLAFSTPACMPDTRQSHRRCTSTAAPWARTPYATGHFHVSLWHEATQIRPYLLKSFPSRSAIARPGHRLSTPLSTIVIHTRRRAAVDSLRTTSISTALRGAHASASCPRSSVPAWSSTLDG